ATALCLMVLAAAREPLAWAESERVLLSGVPAKVEQATRTALSPWKVQVLTLSAGIPRNRPPVMRRRARALAASRGAAAVVWLTPAPEGRLSLWLYDAKSHTLISRPIPSRLPFDDSTAAS